MEIPIENIKVRKCRNTILKEINIHKARGLSPLLGKSYKSLLQTVLNSYHISHASGKWHK